MKKVHHGKLLEKTIDESGITLLALNRRTKIPRSTMYFFLRSEEIHIDHRKKIAEALKSYVDKTNANIKNLLSA
jgi:predicted transcriptional regulator